MSQEEIVKVTSKGQVTIPVGLREKAGLKKGSYIYMKSLGDVVLMKRVEELGLEEISDILNRSCSREGSDQGSPRERRRANQRETVEGKICKEGPGFFWTLTF